MAAYSNRLTRYLEIAANVAIIAVAAVCILVFARNYLFNPDRSHPAITAGTRLAGAAADWRGNDRNLVLILSTTCRYCKESTGFYRKLAHQCQDSHVPIIALFPQPTEAGKAYLDAEGIAVNEVRHADFKELRVSGTPTVVLLDRNGTVKNVWFGKLSGDKENEVLAKLAL